MNKVVRHGSRRGSDVRHGYKAFQFVMAGLVEEITQRDHACRLPSEVHDKHRCAASKDSSDRIQFLSAAAQVVASYHEVGRVEGGSTGKKERVLTIPEPVAWRFRQRCGLDRSDCGRRCKRGRLHRRRLKQRGRNLLAERRAAEAQNAQQNCCPGVQNGTPSFPHDFCEYRHWPPVLVLTQGRSQSEWPLGAIKAFRMITLELARVTGVTPPRCK